MDAELKNTDQLIRARDIAMTGQTSQIVSASELIRTQDDDESIILLIQMSEEAEQRALIQKTIDKSDEDSMSGRKEFDFKIAVSSVIWKRHELQKSIQF